MILLTEPIVLIAFCFFVGAHLGMVKLVSFRLGASATLFCGLFISFLITHFTGITVSIPKVIFDLTLIGFISVVGLKASADIAQTFKKNGLKFIILSASISSTGTLITWLYLKIFDHLGASSIGALVGALTSSPGLGNALEQAANDTARSAIGMGYAIAYIPGILTAVFYAKWMGGKEVAKPTGLLTGSLHTAKRQPFHLGYFALVILVGYVLGQVSIPFPMGIRFSLGATGGVLIAALFLGSRFKVLQFETYPLNLIQSISLNGFLAVVGLNYGYTAVKSIATAGPLLLVLGLSVSVISVAVGHFVGLKILGLNGAALVGGICGGRTSTPGLAAAMEAFEDDAVVTSYGAAYPFALLGMILGTTFLTHII